MAETNDLRKSIENISKRIESAKVVSKKVPLPGFYQPCVFYKKLHKIRVGLFTKKIEFTYPFYSKDVFASQEEAMAYFPSYIKTLITNKDLPEDSVLDGKVNPNVCICATQLCTLGALEKGTEDR
jgi:hypothetical protein